MKDKNKRDSMVIDWLLVILYFVIVLISTVSIYVRSNFMIEFGIPGALVIIVSAVFINYIIKIIHTNPQEQEEKDRD